MPSIITFQKSISILYSEELMHQNADDAIDGIYKIEQTLLLNDILEGGNFGRYSKRFNGRSSFFYQGFVKVRRDIKLLSIAPREVMAVLLRRMRTAIRHMVNKFE